MDENMESQENEKKEKNNTQQSGLKVWQIILIILGIILVEFCAIYTVADWHFKRLFLFPNTSRIEKMINKEMRNMDKHMEYNRKHMFTYPSSTVINMKENDSEYKINIDLKSFNNDKNNIKVKVEDNVLKINAKYVKQTKNNKSVSELQQSYVFENSSELENLTEAVEGDYYVITVPKSMAQD